VKVENTKIRGIFSHGGRIQYRLPIFQREYAWERTQWKTLFDDVMSIHDDPGHDDPSVKITPHFMGAIVVTPDQHSTLGLSSYKIVDGQQRLVTISLLLAALKNNINETDDLYQTIEEYLVNPKGGGDYFFKLVPSDKYRDKQAYFSILRRQNADSSNSRIINAYKFLSDVIADGLSKGKLVPEKLFSCIVNELDFVSIALESFDQPYKIFESLNAKGKPISQADLVRNYIAMRLPTERQEALFNQYWTRIEDALDERERIRGTGELSSFLRHYLSSKLGQLPNRNRVYETFRKRMENGVFSNDPMFVDEIKVIHQHAQYYNNLLRPDNELHSEIRKRLIHLGNISASAAYPFLMYLYSLYSDRKISDEEFIRTLDIIENYLVRRFLADEPTNYLNKMFPALSYAMRDRVAEGGISGMVSTELLRRKYPSDNRLRQQLMLNRVYDKNQQKAVVHVLQTLNRHLSKDSGGYTVLDSTPTIEHIMPQTLTPEWKSHIGDSWEEQHKDYKDTIGNLTLVTQAWNSSLSTGELCQKKEKLAQQALTLNNDYFTREIHHWDVNAIRKRTEYLAGLIIEVWPALGEQSTEDDFTGTVPSSLFILGDRYDVRSWRDVLCKTADTVAELYDFESLPSNFEKTISKLCLNDNYFVELSNGWWIYAKQRSANDIIRFCKNLIQIIDLSEEDWNVQVE